jgi:flavin reductase (DIM6/NTAB) family NADH-FMN oxidoreductase RutF
LGKGIGFMKKFFEISPLDMRENVFNQIGRDWMLITAGRKGSFNTMTASWGGLGVLWNTNVSFIFVRPSRYTYEFIEREKYYSLSFFPDGNRRALQFCGSHSGRDTDKIASTGLTPVFDAQAPYFEQCRLSLICRKLYYQDIDASQFLDPAISGNYLKDDYHRVYVGEIIKVLQSEK